MWGPALLTKIDGCLSMSGAMESLWACRAARTWPSIALYLFPCPKRSHLRYPNHLCRHKLLAREGFGSWLKLEIMAKHSEPGVHFWKDKSIVSPEGWVALGSPEGLPLNPWGQILYRLWAAFGLSPGPQSQGGSPELLWQLTAQGVDNRQSTQMPVPLWYVQRPKQRHTPAHRTPPAWRAYRTQHILCYFMVQVVKRCWLILTRSRLDRQQSCSWL